MEYQLHPRYDSAQSFYGKARIRQEGSEYTLISYETKVAKVSDDGIEIYGFYSATTLRHIKEFLRQFAGLPKCTKADIEKYLI